MKVTLFYDHVTVLDYAFLDHHLGVVGDSQIVDVELTGQTDDEGIVFDFSHAKKKVKEVIDRETDHRLVVPLDLIKPEDGRIYLRHTFGFEDRVLEYSAPLEAVCEIPSSHVDHSNLKTFLEKKVLIEMPDTVQDVKLTFRSENNSDHVGYFHYTHGLRDHYGNCQRLFHGHRNTLIVEVDGVRRKDLEEKLIVSEFQSNVHFCYFDNVVNKDDVFDITLGKPPIGRVTGLEAVEICYNSSQGEYWGRIPGELVYFMPTETTVENLSVFFAKRIRSMIGPGPIIRVRAFEGIAKGSITTL